jgi:hypothetical protein
MAGVSGEIVMSDIILAECGGQAWLVCGEQHIDHLLANTLAAHFSVEVIACESKADVDALWRQYNGAERDERMMWLIHPAIVNRVRGVPAQAGVVFAEWSASLDDQTSTTIRRTADAVRGQVKSRVALVRYLAADGPAMALDLANLRSGMVEARLVELGITPMQMLRETLTPEQPGQVNQIDLVIRST